MARSYAASSFPADLPAFTGYKRLCGPPWTRGEQPEEMPDKFEGGTPNEVEIAGLEASIRFVLERGVETIRAHGAHEVALTTRILDGLQNIRGIRVNGSTDPQPRTAVVSSTAAGRQMSDMGLCLDKEHCHVELYCAPAAHRIIGTIASGTVQVAPGLCSTREDVDAAVEAIRMLVRG